MSDETHGDAPAAGAATRLGRVWLSPLPGTGIGEFDFVVDDAAVEAVEVGAAVAADTTEGTYVGTVVDMRTVGTRRDPVADGYEGPARLAADVTAVVGTVQVLASPARRPVRGGAVRPATAEEVRRATGADRMTWPVPAGGVPLVGGGYAPVHLEGSDLLGPEGAHLLMGGRSGYAAKTSFVATLLRSAIACGDPAPEQRRRVGALLFNVKGVDLLFLDKPAADDDDTDDDRGLRAAMGIDAGPFDGVEVYAPAMPDGASHGPAARSARDDALPLRWDLRDIWDYISLFHPSFHDDEIFKSFYYAFQEHHLRAHSRGRRITTLAGLEAFLDAEIDAMEESGARTGFADLWASSLLRVRRILASIASRAGGLVTRDESRRGDDIPASGWAHGDVVVVDIAGLDVDVQAAVIARTTKRMLRAAEADELGVDSLIIFADELNEYAPATGSKRARVRDTLEETSGQGRYAGVSLWGAAQKLSKTSEFVRDNAGTHVLGRTPDAELDTGAYGRLPSGLRETIATLDRGQVAISHAAYRAPLVARFPRPSWRAGRPDESVSATRPKPVESLGVSGAAAERLTEGIPDEVVEEVLASSDDADEARERLARHRIPDPAASRLEAPARDVDPDDPYGFDID